MQDSYSQVDPDELPDELRSTLLETEKQFIAYMHLLEHGDSIQDVSLIDACPQDGLPSLTELVDTLISKRPIETIDRAWRGQVADTRDSYMDLYAPPLIESSYFGMADYFLSAYEFVYTLLKYACDRVFNCNVPDFKAKETLEKLGSQNWNSEQEKDMQRYICDLSAFLARVGQLPKVSDSTKVMDELLRETRAVHAARKAGKPWAGDRPAPAAAKGRGCDPAKLNEAIRYVRENQPVEKQEMIAMRIGVQLVTFRSNYVPILKERGMQQNPEGSWGFDATQGPPID